MKRKATKWAALLVSGGMLLQLGACLPILADLLLRPIALNIINSAIDNALGGGETQNGDDTADQ